MDLTENLNSPVCCHGPLTSAHFPKEKPWCCWGFVPETQEQRKWVKNRQTLYPSVWANTHTWLHYIHLAGAFVQSALQVHSTEKKWIQKVQESWEYMNIYQIGITHAHTRTFSISLWTCTSGKEWNMVIQSFWTGESSTEQQHWTTICTINIFGIPLHQKCLCSPK